MRKHFVRIIAITAFVIFCMFLPYLQGDYDASAIPFSAMAQLGGVGALLLFPVGLTWLITEMVNQKRTNLQRSILNYRFALVTVFISLIVALFIAFGAFITNHRSLGIFTFVICLYIISKFARKAKQLKTSNSGRLHPAPFYLVCIPLMVVFARFMFVPSATTFSRDLAMRETETLINDIETYKIKNGFYPKSLVSIWDDYDPSITGIDRYYYEASGDVYNIYFEQFSDQIGVKEIVMYNKLDQQEMTSHNEDLLQINPQNIHRGYHAVHNATIPHWKYFWFD